MQENPFQEERQGRNVDNLMKVGMGYDVHRLTEDRDLILGGVKIPWEKGLLGHSDADVLICSSWRYWTAFSRYRSGIRGDFQRKAVGTCSLSSGKKRIWCRKY